MKHLEISSMLLMIKRGYNIYSVNNDTIIQMLSLGLIELVNEELVITEIGDLYLNKIGRRFINENSWNTMLSRL